MNKKISLCIPMYNENSIIADTARTLHEYMSKTFENYDGYKAFFEAEAQKKAEQKDIFRVVKSSAVFDGEDTAEDSYDLAVNM